MCCVRRCGKNDVALKAANNGAGPTEHAQACYVGPKGAYKGWRLEDCQRWFYRVAPQMDDRGAEWRAVLAVPDASGLAAHDAKIEEQHDAFRKKTILAILNEEISGLADTKAEDDVNFKREYKRQTERHLQCIADEEAGEQAARNLQDQYAVTAHDDRNAWVHRLAAEEASGELAAKTLAKRYLAEETGESRGQSKRARRRPQSYEWAAQARRPRGPASPEPEEVP